MNYDHQTCANNNRYDDWHISVEEVILIRQIYRGWRRLIMWLRLKILIWSNVFKWWSSINWNLLLYTKTKTDFGIKYPKKQKNNQLTNEAANQSADKSQSFSLGPSINKINDSRHDAKTNYCPGTIRTTWLTSCQHFQLRYWWTHLKYNLRHLSCRQM